MWSSKQDLTAYNILQITVLGQRVPPCQSSSRWVSFTLRGSLRPFLLPCLLTSVHSRFTTVSSAEPVPTEGGTKWRTWDAAERTERDPTDGGPTTKSRNIRTFKILLTSLFPHSVSPLLTRRRRRFAVRTEWRDDDRRRGMTDRDEKRVEMEGTTSE